MDRVKVGIATTVAMLLMSIFGSAPALADTRAVYRNVEGETLTVEARTNGDSRAEFGNQPFSIIIRGGTSYVVYRQPAPQFVARVDDLRTLISERRLPLEVDMSDIPSLVERGTHIVAGHTGRAIWLDISVPTPRPVFVLSADPAFATLRPPFLALIGFSIDSALLTGGPVPPAFAMIQRELGSSTPLLFAGYFLESVDHEPIDAERFALPSEPIALELLRQWLAVR